MLYGLANASSVSVFHQQDFQGSTRPLCSGVHRWHPHLTEQKRKWQACQNSPDTSPETPTINQGRETRISYNPHCFPLLQYPPRANPPSFHGMTQPTMPSFPLNPASRLLSSSSTQIPISPLSLRLTPQIVA